MGLLTAMSMVGADGVEVPLIMDVARRVTAASGLAGITSRELVVARSGGSGSRNLTRYRDDQPIVINGILGNGDTEDTWAQYDAVAGVFAHAVDTDCVLKWTAGNTLALQRTVRLSSLDGPLEVGPDIISYQATLRASDPNAYSQRLHTAWAVPLGSLTGGGWDFPMLFPQTFNQIPNTVAAFTNSGFIPTPPVFVLNGMLVNPVIELTPAVRLLFAGTVAGGDTLTVDVAARTVLLNGSVNRRYMVDSPNSTWFDLPRGSGTVTLLATGFSPGANLQVSWRDARS